MDQSAIDIMPGIVERVCQNSGLVGYMKFYAKKNVYAMIIAYFAQFVIHIFEFWRV